MPAVFDETYYASPGSIELFRKKLQAIERKHKAFFQSTPSFFTNLPPAKLNEYASIFEEDKSVRFRIVDHSLPNEIQKDCIEAFRGVFG